MSIDKNTPDLIDLITSGRAVSVTDSILTSPLGQACMLIVVAASVVIGWNLLRAFGRWVLGVLLMRKL